MSKESLRFKPHFNREFCDKANPNGKMVHTKSDYLSELKKRDLVPYSKPKEKVDPVYKTSKWAHGMVNQIKRGNVGQVFRDELKKKGYDIEKMARAQETAKKMGVRNQSSGGFQ